MTDTAGRTTQNADESVHGSGAATVQNIRLEIPPDNLRWQSALILLSLAASIVAAIFSFFAFQELSAAEYWLSRNEAFLEQLAGQGVHIPNDLLRHKEH